MRWCVAHWKDGKICRQLKAEQLYAENVKLQYAVKEFLSVMEQYIKTEKNVIIITEDRYNYGEVISGYQSEKLSVKTLQVELTLLSIIPEIEPHVWRRLT